MTDFGMWIMGWVIFYWSLLLLAAIGYFIFTVLKP